MNKIHTLFLTLVAAVFLAACSNQPGTGFIEDQVRAQHGDDETIFKIVSVDKTNGHMDGDGRYIAMVDTGIEFTISYADAMSRIDQEQGNMFEKMQARLAMRLFKGAFGDFEEGDRNTISKKYLFIDTDEGWMLQGEVQ